MEISERKSQMLYKNETGGRIMVRITLPSAEPESEFEKIYRQICESYLESAKKYINAASVQGALFLDVSFDAQIGEKEIKIKRLAVLKQGAEIIKRKAVTDVFRSADLTLKR